MDRFIKLLWEQISQINQGRTANKGEVTLTASAATTDVAHPGFETTMAVLFLPLTANAAAEQANATMYVSAKVPNQFTITHANNAQADRTYDYIVVG